MKGEKAQALIKEWLFLQVHGLSPNEAFTEPAAQRMAKEALEGIQKIERLAAEYQSPETQRLIEIGRATVEAFSTPAWVRIFNKMPNTLINNTNDLLEWHRAQEVQHGDD